MNTLNRKIGFIGMGLMGIPMSLRLLAAGFSVTVWNRSPEKTATVVAKGATQASSIAELTAQSDIIMLSVTDTHAVEEVIFGAQGVASAGNAQKILIDFSSIHLMPRVDLPKNLIMPAPCHGLMCPFQVVWQVRSKAHSR